MWYLIIGLLIWVDGHFYRLLPIDWRQKIRSKMGNKAMAFLGLYILIGVILMVIGYRVWDAPQAYSPPSWGVHANYLLSLFGFALMGARDTKSSLRRVFRHPMLSGFAIWSVGHLLARGSWAALILWGGLLIWALLMIVMQNRKAGAWDRNSVEISRQGDLKLAFATVVGGAIIIGLHHWLI